MTFEELKVDSRICEALKAKEIETPLPFQYELLSNTVQDFNDVIGQFKADSGHLLLLAVFAAHCLLSSDQKKNNVVVIIASSREIADKLYKILVDLRMREIVASLVPENKPPFDLTQTRSRNTVFIGVLHSIRAWPPRNFENCVSLLVEDYAKVNPHELQTLLNDANRSYSRDETVNYFILSTDPPCKVIENIRYFAITRKNRVYVSLNSPEPTFTYLYAEKNRTQLITSLVKVSSLKKLLILTHKRDQPELLDLLKKLKMNFLNLKRDQTTEDHKRITNSFLSSENSIIVSMHGCTAFDLVDIDAVIQYNPPQKSMSEAEWQDYLYCLKHTGDSINPKRILVITLLNNEDLSLGSYFMAKTNSECPVLNVNPFHKQLADIIQYPLIVSCQRIGKFLQAIHFSDTSFSTLSSNERNNGNKWRTGRNNLQKHSNNDNKEKILPNNNIGLDTISSSAVGNIANNIACLDDNVGGKQGQKGQLQKNNKRGNNRYSDTNKEKKNLKSTTKQDL